MHKIFSIVAVSGGGCAMRFSKSHFPPKDRGDGHIEQYAAVLYLYQNIPSHNVQIPAKIPALAGTDIHEL